MKAIVLLAVLFSFALLSVELVASQDDFSSIPVLDTGTNQEQVTDSRPENLRVINIWRGNTSTSWFARINWSLGRLPLSTDDVEIPVVNSGLYPVMSANGVCNSLNVTSGASLNISSGGLVVTNDANINGVLIMSSSPTLDVNGNLVFNTNAVANFTSNPTISVKKNVSFFNGSSVNIPNTTLKLIGTYISYIYTYTPTVIGTLYTYKPVSGSTNISVQSTADLSIESLEVASYSKISHPYTGTTIVRGNIVLNPTSSVNINAGTLSMEGATDAFISDLNSTNNYLNHLRINKTVGVGVYMNTNLTVKGKVDIPAGSLMAQSSTLTVGGDWSNSDGYIGFYSGTGKVIFNKTGGTQTVSGVNDFYRMEDNHTGGALEFLDYTQISSLTVNNHVVFVGLGNLQNVSNTPPGAILDFYNVDNNHIGSYTGGGHLRAYGGSHVKINDLTDSSLLGSYTADGGHLEIHQDSYNQIYLNGNMTIHNNGIVDIYGGSLPCYIAYNSNCVFTMSSGSFNVKDNGIFLYDGGYNCDFIISGGTITANGDWRDTWGIFDPTGGSVVLTGTGDNNITQHADSWFWNLAVNKVAGREGPEPQFSTDRDGNQTPITRSSNLNIYAVTIKGGLDIQNANMVYLLGDMNSINNGTINIENAKLLVQFGYLISTGTLNINANGELILNLGILHMGNGSNINVNDGGALWMDAGGISRSSSGYYGLNVESGGTISAFGSDFSYMNGNGIMLKAGSLVHPDATFDACTFSHGAQYGRLLTINNSQDFIVEGANFPINTWDSIYNVSKAVDSGTVYFKNWTGNFSGPSHEQDPHQRLFWQYYDEVPSVTDLSISYMDAFSGIVLDWKHPVSSGITFNIYRSANPDGPFDYRDSVYDNNIWWESVPGSFYFYQVRADLPWD